MASESGTSYIGVTDNLIRRVYEHKTELIKGFTQKYGCKKLIYYEQVPNVESAILREKQLKKWRRKKKEILIREMNSGWKDLYSTIL